MGASTPCAPDWDAMAELYHDLAIIERYRPGSEQARDVEDAISILLEGRISSTEPRHRGYDAVRRARFLRHQAARQRPIVLARLNLPEAARSPRLDDGAFADRAGEPSHDITPEAVVCARETVWELSRPARRGPGVHAGVVLAGLLADQPVTVIAADLKISRATVDRCIAQLREHARLLLMVAA